MTFVRAAVLTWTNKARNLLLCDVPGLLATFFWGVPPLLLG